MSLSVPAVLAAAAESMPDRTVPVVDRWVSCAELDALTRAEAQALLAAGFEASGRLTVSSMASFAEMIRALAALRAGLVLTRHEVSPASPAGRTADAEVLSEGVWSQTPAAEMGDADRPPVITHGDLLALAQDGNGGSAGWLQPLVQLVRALTRVGA